MALIDCRFSLSAVCVCVNVRVCVCKRAYMCVCMHYLYSLPSNQTLMGNYEKGCGVIQMVNMCKTMGKHALYLYQLL